MFWWIFAVPDREKRIAVKSSLIGTHFRAAGFIARSDPRWKANSKGSFMILSCRVKWMPPAHTRKIDDIYSGASTKLEPRSHSRLDVESKAFVCIVT